MPFGKALLAGGVLFSGVRASRPDRKAEHSHQKLEAGFASSSDDGLHQTVGLRQTAKNATNSSNTNTNFTNLAAVDSAIVAMVDEETEAATGRETAFTSSLPNEESSVPISQPTTIAELEAYFLGRDVGDESSAIALATDRLVLNMDKKIAEAFSDEQNYQNNDEGLPDLNDISGTVQGYHGIGSLTTNVEALEELWTSPPWDFMEDKKDLSDAGYDGDMPELLEEMQAMTDSIRFHYCQAPNETDDMWTALPRLSFEDKDSGQWKFESFENAWLACGATDWCGQVVKVEHGPNWIGLPATEPTDQTVDEYNFWQTKVDAETKYLGYFLAKRSAAALNVKMMTNYVTPVKNASGCDAYSDYNNTKTCDAPCQVTELSNLTGGVLQKLTTIKHAVCGVMTVRAVDYACKPLCPSSCLRMKDAPDDSWEVCNSCAGATRTCSTCKQETFEGNDGCSGNCLDIEMDCRDCSGKYGGVHIWEMTASTATAPSFTVTTTAPSTTSGFM